MSQTFQSSLERALQKQDHQIESSFAELKQIMRQSQQPNPAKKAKAQHPPREVDADEMNPEDDIWLSSGKHPNRQCGEIVAVRIIIRFSQHDVLMALPSVFALHPIFSHSVIYGTLCNLNLKGPSRYRPEVDLRLNAQINLGSFQHNVCHKDELTLFLPLGRVYPEKCTHKKSSPKKNKRWNQWNRFLFFPRSLWT